MAVDYQPPLDRLLTYGSVEDMPEWPNYLALGLSAAHVPELIRMALDEQLNDSDVRARACGRRSTPSARWGSSALRLAAEPLIGLFSRIDDADDDWIADQLPVVYGCFRRAGHSGPERTSLADPQPYLTARLAALDGLREIVQQHLQYPRGGRRGADALCWSASSKIMRFNGWLASPPWSS